MLSRLSTNGVDAAGPALSARIPELVRYRSHVPDGRKVLGSHVVPQFSRQPPQEKALKERAWRLPDREKGQHAIKQLRQLHVP